MSTAGPTDPIRDVADPIEPFPGEVIKMWRENRTLGEIAAKLDMSVDSVYRLIVLTGEMRRSIEADSRESPDA